MIVYRVTAATDAYILGLFLVTASSYDSVYHRDYKYMEGASRVKFGSAVMGGKLKSWMNTTQFLGYTWNQKNLKQESQNWVFYICFAFHYYRTFTNILNSITINSSWKDQIADISIILERSRKCVIEKLR